MRGVFAGLFGYVLLAVAFLQIGCTPGSTDGVTADWVKTPEEELAGFRLPEGFVIELVASEKDGIVNPIDLTFDDAGRLWTQTASMYPLDPVEDIQGGDLLRLMNDHQTQENHPAFRRIRDLYRGKTKGSDKILILSELYDRGKSAKVSVWADGLTIPMSILPYKKGAYVAQGSELFFLDDENGDGRSDKRIPMFTGFGYTDTHTMVHTLVRGPGDWIYFSQGALNKGEVSSLHSDVKLKLDFSKIARFSLDARDMELVSSGLNNIWGFQLRDNGQWWGTEANDLGYSIVPLEPGTGFPGIGGERLRDYQPWMPELYTFRVGGTGISGLAFADDLSGTFPAEWKDVALLANPITSTINAVRVVRNADGSLSAEHLPDLLSSEDKYFRPVNMEFGPDGCLYIADWYNKIISHNEVPTSDPTRDKTHGRIWRIRHTSQQPRPVPDISAAATASLVDYLKSPSGWAKRAAWHQITDRPAAETKQLTGALAALAGDPSQDETSRIMALWALEGIKSYDEKLMSELLKSGQDNLRREAVRSLVSFSLSPDRVGAALSDLVEDPNPMVRSQVLRTLTDIRAADHSVIDILVKASKPELPGDTLGGPYERKFERYLARKALEQYARELQAYMDTKDAALRPPGNLIWASQALPKEQKEAVFIRLWPSANIKELDESTFILVAGMLENEKIRALVKPVFDNRAQAGKYLEMALRNQQQVQSPELATLLEIPVRGLLKGNSVAENELALDAIGRLKIKAPFDIIAAFINDRATAQTVNLALKALENDPEANRDIFIKIAKDDKLDFDARLSAFHSLAKTDTETAETLLQQWIPSLSDEQKRTFVTAFSGSDNGSEVLLIMYGKQRIDLAAFGISAAERIHNSNPANEKAAEILGGVKKRIEEEKKAFAARLARYVAIAEKKSGDAEKGKVIFQTCLMCHRVGNEGHSIAPALDGSAARENEALLTAILDPDAAVEGGYAVYRVVKKDNSTIEGYLVSREDRGTTLAFMGGSRLFIESADIKSQGFLGGRSFMPKGLLDGYNDEQVADLLAYIRTLQ